jgi:phosphoribosylformylglycinamidine (FGAM) synthase PurS component
MIIEIRTKEKYAKSEEEGFMGRMAHAGLEVKAARLSRLYRVDAPFSRAEFARLGAGLLADPITELYSLSQWRPALKKAWRVEVWLKDSVTDVVGESVKGAIADALGKEPAAVRFGRAYYVACDSELKLRHAVVKTLVNETVNKFRIEKI